jgi:D-amino-acid dehydrogenase
MKVAVIGAGIIGVTTAFELAADGHEVTVFERRAAVAEETSFANAGVVAPGYVTPWAAPGMPARWRASCSAGMRRCACPAAVAREIALDVEVVPVLRLASYLANRARMQRLAFYSRTRLHDITEHFQLEYDRSSGYMVLLRARKDRKLVQPACRCCATRRGFKEIERRKRARSSRRSTRHRVPGAIHLPKTKSATAASSRCC